MRPINTQRSAFCSKSRPARPVAGTGVGVGAITVPLLVAAGGMPVLAVPMAPTELLLTAGGLGA